MENTAQKIKKLEEVICLLEGNQKPKKKLTLEAAKIRLKARDPGFDIKESISYLNKGSKKEILISFLNENYLTPYLIKLINKL
ncbi:MAG: hypothetical protein WBF48_06350 [Halarcobacter sp.]